MPGLIAGIERPDDACSGLKCSRWPALQGSAKSVIKSVRGYPVVHLSAFFSPCVGGEISAHGYQLPEFQAHTRKDQNKAFSLGSVKKVLFLLPRAGLHLC